MAKYLLYKINLTKKLKMSFVRIKNYSIKRNIPVDAVTLSIDPIYIMYYMGIKTTKGEFFNCYNQNNRLLCTVDNDGLKAINENISFLGINNYSVYQGVGKFIGSQNISSNYIKSYREIVLKDAKGNSQPFYRLYDSNGNQRFMTDGDGLSKLVNESTFIEITNLKVYKGVATPLDVIGVNPYDYIGNFQEITITLKDIKETGYIAYNPNGGVLFTVTEEDYSLLIRA
jgi:hypothetical protein